ncbi:hypothetical protein ACHWQZ_G016961 [Mnemiopsis leidyi]
MQSKIKGLLVFVTYASVFHHHASGEDEIKWREDGKCSLFNPLPDGSAAECNPSGDSPCCDNGYYGITAQCGNSPEYCSCPLCLDFRAVEELRRSGEECMVVEVGGFLKIRCVKDTMFGEELYFKCVQSGGEYRPSVDHHPDDFDFTLRSVSAICEDDPHVYQACGFTEKVTNSDVFCGGLFCTDSFDSGNFIECDGNCSANRSCSAQNTDSRSTLCNDKCDNTNFLTLCEDESFCNGYRYGVSCLDSINSYWGVQDICDGIVFCSDGGQDEENCDVFGDDIQTCSHYYLSVFQQTEKIVPIFNNTRCSVIEPVNKVYPYCLNYRDQTNCTDTDRVGGYCLIDGFSSSVSKYVLCKDYDETAAQHIVLCDDNFQNVCISPSSTTNCRVHKHRMCDGKQDCSDKSDEVNELCRFMTKEFKCERRFSPGKKLGIPVSWIFDVDEDCMNGEDEDDDKWEFCGNKEKVSYRLKPDDGVCENVFLCPGNDRSYVLFEQLCDGVETCGVNGRENAVCQVARDFGLSRNSSVMNGSLCLSGDALNDSLCSEEQFTRPGGVVFGVESSISLIAPHSKVDCRHAFGEYYVYLSCMGKCSDAGFKCPLKKQPLRHDSCPGQYPDRVYTLANNSSLTFVTRTEQGTYHQDYFQCDNGRCVEYKQVCDLFDDCGDMSDELNCKNHMICADTGNSTKHQLISLSHKCDGIYDCFDLSDECNDKCHKEILGNSMLKCLCWLQGLLAVILNFITIYGGIVNLRRMKTSTSSILVFCNKVLVISISCGDFLVGLYLIGLSIFDGIVYKADYCKRQAEWLTGTECSVLGVISTVGSQISLFAMTALCSIRMLAVFWKRLTFPCKIGRREGLSVFIFVAVIFVFAFAIAITPLVPSLEDYFVQGMYYDPKYKVFIGFPNKERHVKVLQTYYDSMNITDEMSWREIGEKVDGMFSQDHERLGRSTVHFYGNDGHCLFKYFVRTDDARRSRQTDMTEQQGDVVVWLMLALNLVCFIIITVSSSILCISRRVSSKKLGHDHNATVLKQNMRLQRKITAIVATDFLCWVPFIMISGLHNLQIIDATFWYDSFALTVLPFNSVINPLLYDSDSISRFCRRVKNKAKLIKRARDVSLYIYGEMHQILTSASDFKSIRNKFPLISQSTGIQESDNYDSSKPAERNCTGGAKVGDIGCNKNNMSHVDDIVTIVYDPDLESSPVIANRAALSLSQDHKDKKTTYV